MLYDYECAKGHLFNRILPLKDYKVPQKCECGARSTKLIGAPGLLKRRETYYQSPIDGKPITTDAARREDMARSGSIEYDPGVKQDYQARIDRGNAAIEKTIDSTVETAIHHMDTGKRERLYAELAGGAEVDVERRTVAENPVKMRVRN